MTINRADYHSPYIVSCDNCGEEIDDAFDDFPAAVQALKTEGWKFRKDDDGKWEHFCPACRGDY